MVIYPLLSCRKLLGLLPVLFLAHDEERQHVRRLAKKLWFSDLNMLTLEAEETPCLLARRGALGLADEENGLSVPGPHFPHSPLPRRFYCYPLANAGEHETIEAGSKISYRVELFNFI